MPPSEVDAIVAAGAEDLDVHSGAFRCFQGGCEVEGSVHGGFELFSSQDGVEDVADGDDGGGDADERGDQGLEDAAEQDHLGRLRATVPS